eukprot:762682-Hanusia_phi.AAC.1
MKLQRKEETEANKMKEEKMVKELAEEQAKCKNLQWKLDEATKKMTEVESQSKSTRSAHEKRSGEGIAVASGDCRPAQGRGEEVERGSEGATAIVRWSPADQQLGTGADRAGGGGCSAAGGNSKATGDVRHEDQRL